MSTEFDDSELAERLRVILKARGISQRAISKDLGVPYRTVQNYLGGEIRIPAIFFLKLCHYIGIEADYFIYQDFSLSRPDVYDAIIRALEKCDLLPPRPPGDTPQTDAERETWRKRIELASQMAASFGEAYERYRREWLEKGMKVKTTVPFGERYPRQRS